MTIRWIQDGEPHVAEVYNRPLRDFVLEAEATYAPATRSVTVSNGITGGGQLTGDIAVTGVDATTNQVGVSRFATLSEVRQGTAQNVGISPSTFSQIPLGVGSSGQQWYDMLHARNTGTTYYNNTGRPIVVAVRSGHDLFDSNFIFIACNINGVEVPIGGYSDEYNRSKINAGGSVIVPAGASYRVHTRSITMVQHKMLAWVELR